MNKFTITKEIEVDDLPENMLMEITDSAINESDACFSIDGLNISIGNSYYYSTSIIKKFSIERLIDEICDKTCPCPDTAKRLIPTLELALERLKVLSAEYENNTDTIKNS